MKVDSVYYFQDDTKNPIVLYEFDTNKEAIECCNECDKRKTRQTCFESNGKYYVGKYITKDTMQFITSHFKIAEQYLHPELANVKSNICFWTEQEAYGDRQYFFDNETKQFSTTFLSIGD
jgi:hypothetical protein